LSATDIFISYAHADDEVPQGARLGWVTTLTGELKKILRRKLGGPDVVVWMDHQLAANKSVSEELLDGSESAALYVYKGAINHKALQRKLDELVAPGAAAPRRAARKK